MHCVVFARPTKPQNGLQRRPICGGIPQRQIQKRDRCLRQRLRRLAGDPSLVIWIGAATPAVGPSGHGADLEGAVLPLDVVRPDDPVRDCWCRVRRVRLVPLGAGLLQGP